MEKKISKEENNRIKGIMKILIERAETIEDCLNVNYMIQENISKGYNIQSLEKEIAFKYRTIDSLKYSQN